jgi:hypothetical protein
VAVAEFSAAAKAELKNANTPIRMMKCVEWYIYCNWHISTPYHVLSLLIEA